MNEKQEKKRRYNLRLEYIAHFNKWLDSEPPRWRFIRWRKWKKSRLIIEHQKGRRRLMFDLHSVLGLYAALILLVCALTGLMWSFQWYRDIVSFIFDAEVKRGAPIWKIVRALHFGTYAGMFSKIVTFIAALIGTSLPVTGYWMYLKRKKLL